MYELATFKHPFTAQNERALASKVLRGQYPALPKSFSSDMSSMVQLMLQVDPNKRPTASQLLEHPLVLKASECNALLSSLGYFSRLNAAKSIF